MIHIWRWDIALLSSEPNKQSKNSLIMWSNSIWVTKPKRTHNNITQPIQPGSTAISIRLHYHNTKFEPVPLGYQLKDATCTYILESTVAHTPSIPQLSKNVGRGNWTPATLSPSYKVTTLPKQSSVMFGKLSLILYCLFPSFFFLEVISSSPYSK